jgi:hypothetical protein
LDLLECVVCDRRFLVAHAEDGKSLPCPCDSQELRLVVRGLPGTPAQIEEALNARCLDAKPSDS